MRRRARPLPNLIASLMQASGETILRRTAMMARGTCNAAEYQRMVTEKMHASRRAGLALMRGQGPHAVLAPYLRAATANARRLRGK